MYDQESKIYRLIQRSMSRKYIYCTAMCPPTTEQNMFEFFYNGVPKPSPASIGLMLRNSRNHLSCRSVISRSCSQSLPAGNIRRQTAAAHSSRWSQAHYPGTLRTQQPDQRRNEGQPPAQHRRCGSHSIEPDCFMKAAYLISSAKDTRDKKKSLAPKP